MRRLLALAAGAMVFSQPAGADIDNSAYDAGGAVRDPRERTRLERQLRQDVEADRRRAAAEAKRVEHLRQEAIAQNAARPYPERLTEQHCTLCHTAENYTAKRHTWLGWRLVVARMVWLNDAPIAFDAQGIIANHLAETYVALPDEEVAEFAAAAAAIIPILVAPWAGLMLLHGRRSYSGPRQKRRDDTGQ
jgi:hypothetical protein